MAPHSLYACAAVNGVLNFEGIVAGARSYPSGGALYPLELYPGLQRVEGIRDGITITTIPGRTSWKKCAPAISTSSSRP